MATVRADAGEGKGGQGHEAEGVPAAQRHPPVMVRARAMATARETVIARGTAREMARASARVTAFRKQQQSSTAAAGDAAILPLLLRCSPASCPSCHCCCYVFAEAVAGWVWVA
jgi:hypothetical protein